MVGTGGCTHESPAGARLCIGSRSIAVPFGLVVAMIGWQGFAGGRPGVAAEPVPASVISEERWAALLQTPPPPEELPRVLDPNQPGNIARGAGEVFEGRSDVSGTVLDPNQVGNLAARLSKLEGEQLPLIRLSGFLQLDDGLYSQSAASRSYFGDMQDGVGFRRARLQAIGKLTEFTGYTIEMDFAQAGRPSFADVWGEQTEVPFFGTIRVGQFRMPGTMDSWTSIRHLNFLERSGPFQAMDPFRRVGIMAYAMSEDERTSWAYAVFGTGLTFWNGSSTVYSTFGDNRSGTQIGDNGGVSLSSRITHLLWYDEPSEGRYLLHVGTGYLYSQLGGEGTTGDFAKTYRSVVFPEFFVGDPLGGGLTAAGTPRVLDSGRILATDFSLYHAELAFNRGSFNFQTEAMLEPISQLNGPTMLQYGAYMQCGYFLTGEHAAYLKQAGVFDYNVVPFTPFFGTGRRGRVMGWGAWELAFRWSYVDMTLGNLVPANQLSGSAGPPASPSRGVLNESTVGVNWWWNRFTRVQFNWIYSVPDYPGTGAAPFDIFGTRFQVEF
jgi:phosphate-selective porin OprO/OprP